MGLYNVVFGHYYVLDTIAPWIRGIVTLQPNQTLMLKVPLSYKVHILSALALLAYSPFSRLVHIWSAPLVFPLRSNLLFRRIAE
jgi:nitrate reductase gamma subunit